MAIVIRTEAVPVRESVRYSGAADDQGTWRLCRKWLVALECSWKDFYITNLGRDHGDSKFVKSNSY